MRDDGGFVKSILDRTNPFGHSAASMYAVIETGGKQYGIMPGTIVEVEKLTGDVGAPVQFDQVLFCSESAGDNSQIWLGKPYLSGAKVEGQIVGQGRGEKVFIVKMKRRKQYRRTQGHRQFQTQILITSVENGAGAKKALSDSEVKTTLSTFHTQLKAKGPARTNPNQAPWNFGLEQEKPARSVKKVAKAASAGEETKTEKKPSKTKASASTKKKKA